MTENLFLTTTKIAEHFGDGSLSPVELLDATVERANSVQSRLNPFRMVMAVSVAIVVFFVFYLAFAPS